MKCHISLNYVLVKLLTCFKLKVRYYLKATVILISNIQNLNPWLRGLFPVDHSGLSICLNRQVSTQHWHTQVEKTK